ncbi:hypothetical protein EWU23_13540 [Cytophagaceae bacterium 50C-KIRBA]|uniref:Uncharacterized protein n=1 Tax=Aquirufa beregesia TaxID=2516556 RepID=A0ABX0F1V4_9BACT|nr:hypothetical protein [Aquirufa beregesia]NGZ45501.1 hypothetical protein [Aquirufa beregesia]
MDKLIEYHPRINENQELFKTNKIILGSFPTWPLTRCEINDTATSLAKEAMRISSGDIQYFYGSANNRFWSWYKKYIDDDIDGKDIKSIETSLRKNKMDITDTIFSCKRKGKSALDKDLSNRKYNHNFFHYPAINEKIKILCTSKGVMNEMLLNKSFFNFHKDLKISTTLSEEFQNNIMQTLNCKCRNITRPIFRSLQVKNGGKIECLAIPSPGSPYRRLIDFGHADDNNNEFLQAYLSIAFSWFNS